MKEITNIDCKIFLSNIFEDTLTGQWIYLGKKNNAENNIVRQFKHNHEGVVEITEISNVLYLTGQHVKQSVDSGEKQTWQNYLHEHFSDQVFLEENFTLKEKLDEYLATVHHGMQHNEGTVRFVDYQGVKCLETELMANLLIPLKDLEHFGYVLQKNMSAVDFLNRYWNWY